MDFYEGMEPARLYKLLEAMQARIVELETAVTKLQNAEVYQGGKSIKAGVK